jgi:hypothetical protein
MACGILVNIPGPPGPAGTPATNGTDGQSAYSFLLSEFTQPAVGGSGVAEMDSTAWIVPSSDVGGAGQVDGTLVLVQFLGYFLVSDIIDANHVILFNLGYPNSAPAGTPAPSGSRVGVGGRQGP